MNTQGLNSITEEFQRGFEHFSIQLTSAAMDLAMLLASITLIMSILLMVLQGEELNKFFSKIIQTCLLFGLFFGLIKLCGTWVPDIINSFMQVGAKSSGLGSLSPNSVFETGANIAESMFSLIYKMGITHLPAALIAIICGFFVLIIYCFITGELVVNLVKAYALVSVGPIIFALGNSDFTRSTVINYLKKVIGMGIHLMMLYVIVGIGVSLGAQWIHVFKTVNSASGFVLSAIVPVMGGLIVLYLVMKNVPAFIAEISGAGGFRNYGDAAVASALSASALIGSTVAKSAGIGGLGARGLYHGVGAAASGARVGASAGYSGGSSLGSGAHSVVGSVAKHVPGVSSIPGGEKTGNLFKAASKGLGGVAAGGIGVVAGAPAGVAGSAGKAAFNRVKRYLDGNKSKS